MTSPMSAEAAARPVDEVAARLAAVEARLPRDDGVRVFARVYRAVTERIALRVRDDTFADPPFVVHLCVVFAGFFFAAEQAMQTGQTRQTGQTGQGCPKAWLPSAEHRRRPGVLPVQHALAGMNAHINHDLALAVVAACEQARVDPHRGAVHSDYERVNGVLAEVVRPIRQSFLDHAIVEIGAPLSPLADLISAFSLDKARDAAWVSASTLWELRRIEPLSAAFRRSLSSTVGMIGRHLLTPLATAREVDAAGSVEDVEALLVAPTA